MGRIKSTRVIADTQVIAANIDGKNTCVFNGLSVSSTDITSAQTAYFTVYEDFTVIGAGLTTGTFASSGNTFTVTGGALKNQNITAGMMIQIDGSTADDGIKKVVSLDAAGNVLTLDSVTANGGEDIMLTPVRKVASFNWVYAADSSKSQPTETWNYTNGIVCRNGLRIVSTNWTNLEAYVLHS